MITMPDGSTSDEEVVARFLNSEAHWQVVTDGPDAKCPTCGYPERHRVYDVDVTTPVLLADGCPSCEKSRIPGLTIDEAAKALGIELLPWQRDVAQHLLNGERGYIAVGGRRAGLATLRRVVAHATIGASDD